MSNQLINKKLMLYELKTIPIEKQEMLRSMEAVTGKEVREIMQNFSAGKIKDTKAGKLRIVNAYFPKLKDSGLERYEEHYVFFALEKQKQSFFSKPTYRIFVCPLEWNVIFALPLGSVVLEKPDQNSKETVFLTEKGEEHPVHKENYGGRERVCFFEKMQLFREFAVEEAKMTCIRDFVDHHFRWVKPDPWVRERFTITEDKDPMFYLRNEPTEIPGWSVRLSYPRRPPLWGWEIDE